MTSPLLSVSHQLNLLFYYLSRYDSTTDSSRNDMKRKFALTMEFVEEYLKEVVNQPFPFGDKEKNKLTFEVFKKLKFIFFVPSAHSGRKRASNPLEPGDWEPRWCWKPKLRSSGQAADALNHGAVSPAPLEAFKRVTHGMSVCLSEIRCLDLMDLPFL